MKIIVAVILFSVSTFADAAENEYASVARHWNETLLDCIRLDTARPTVHARNLFHLSATMWDVWVSYQRSGKRVFFTGERVSGTNEEIAASISSAASHILRWRFRHSLNYERMLAQIEDAEKQAAINHGFNWEEDSQAEALGKQIAQQVIDEGLRDGANEINDYQSTAYSPVNPAFNPNKPGNRTMQDINRWQPLDIPGFVGQSGIVSENYPPFVGPEWGNVKPFALSAEDTVTHQRDGQPFTVYLDQGPPPQWPAESTKFADTFSQVILAASELDPEAGIQIDISPASRGNAKLASYQQQGYSQNPITGKPYQPHLTNAADFYRVLAEYWADGPNSETPPGHWFVILNIVSDQPELSAQMSAAERLEWDLRAYLALGGAMHDAAIAAWSHKGYYDFARPISVIRKLCELGQSTDQSANNYHPHGIKLISGSIASVSNASLLPGGTLHGVHGISESDAGKIAIRSWRGPEFLKNTSAETAGVGWMLCENWWPYQRPNFVTPPFAGYVSGHSTFSRAAAEVLTNLTGSAYFPGGIGIFSFRKNEFLQFERGPSQDFSLRWATYRDAADDSALSRIYGGIHPPADDLPGRRIGAKVGQRAYEKATQYYPN